MTNTHEHTNTIFIKTTDLLKALKAVAPAMGTEEVRYYLKGVLFEPIAEKNTINLVATDGHRLIRYAINTEPTENQTAPLKPFIMPSSMVNTLTKTKIAKHDSGFTKITVTSEESNDVVNIAVDINGTITQQKAVDGNFPDYKRVIPELKDDMPMETMPAFNAYYLADIATTAKALNKTGVKIVAADATSPAHVLMDDDALTYILMPMRS